MPREITLVTTERVELDHLLAAAMSLGEVLTPRLVLRGWAVQLVDADDVAVLTVEQSRRLDVAADVRRILGQDPPPGTLWWTEATAPWGRVGEAGVRVARAVAERLAARIAVTESG